MDVRRRAATLVLLVAAALFLAACGSGESSEAAAAAPGADLASMPLSGGFPTLDGDFIELNSLEGQDVVLWFWAPW